MENNNIPQLFLNQAFNKDAIDQMKEQIKEMKDKQNTSMFSFGNQFSNRTGSKVQMAVPQVELNENNYFF